jgi:hypothetical protein
MHDGWHHGKRGSAVSMDEREMKLPGVSRE